MGLVGIGAVTVEARVGHWDEDAMRRSFRTRPILNAESQGFTLGWYAVPRWSTRMSRGCGAWYGHGRGIYSACRDWTGQVKIFQGVFFTR